MMIPLVPVISTPAKKARETGFDQIVQPILDAFEYSGKLPELFSDKAKITVDQVVSHLAYIYEKLRNVIDFKEEKLLRKNALERVLKRRLGMGGTAENISLSLIKELIRAGYIENNSVPEMKIGEIRAIIDKYVRLANLVYKKESKLQQKEIFQWFFGMAAVEIDRLLVYQGTDDSLMAAMEEVVKKSVVLERIKMSEEDRSLQFFLAIRRTFVRSDEAMINYDLWMRSFPEWKEPTDELLEEFAGHIDEIYNRFEAEKNHPLAEKLKAVMKRYSVLFQILEDVIRDDPGSAAQVMRDPEAFEEKVRAACDERYSSTKKKLRRSAVRAILYIFITKMLLGIILEFPIDMYILRHTNITPIIINSLFHPIFMFIVILWIRAPGDNNTDRIVNGLRMIVYEGGNTKSPNRIRADARRGRLSLALFSVFYLALYFLSFGSIIYALDRWLDFSFVSIIIFLFFLSTITFFAIRLRQNAAELLIIKKRQGVTGFIVDIFAIPLVRVGYWFSKKLPKINVFIFIFDVILEAPFKAFIEIFEDWIGFLKEKKEEVY